jgi:hypothetical protein
MKTTYFRRTWMLIFMACALFSSCKDHEKTSGLGKEHTGTWLAKGPLLMGGYQHGKYGIQMNLLENGSCQMDVRIDTNKTNLSEKLTNLIKLEGKWSVVDGKVQTVVNAKSWIVTDHASYRKEEKLDDFASTYVFRSANGVLAHGKSFDDSMDLKTTEDAGMRLMSKGRQIMLDCPKFSKFNTQAP